LASFELLPTRIRLDPFRKTRRTKIVVRLPLSGGLQNSTFVRSGKCARVRMPSYCASCQTAATKDQHPMPHCVTLADSGGVKIEGSRVRSGSFSDLPYASLRVRS